MRAASHALMPSCLNDHRSVAHDAIEDAVGHPVRRSRTPRSLAQARTESRPRSHTGHSRMRFSSHAGARPSFWRSSTMAAAVHRASATRARAAERRTARRAARPVRRFAGGRAVGPSHRERKSSARRDPEEWPVAVLHQRPREGRPHAGHEQHASGAHRERRVAYRNHRCGHEERVLLRRHRTSLVTASSRPSAHETHNDPDDDPTNKNTRRPHPQLYGRLSRRLDRDSSRVVDAVQQRTRGVLGKVFIDGPLASGPVAVVVDDQHAAGNEPRIQGRKLMFR